MSPELLFWLSLLLKMIVTAAFVVIAARVTEWVGPMVGALVATLPIAAGPSYFFLALDHDSGFISQAALGSVAAHSATGVFSLVYALLAQRWGMALSVAGAVGSWFAAALAMRSVEWTFGSAAAANLAIYAVCIALTTRYRHVPLPPVRRRWYDVPLRAGMVAALVAAVVTSSFYVGPTFTGLLAIYPIVMTCLMLIFHPRAGGPATAALIANTMWGLVGFSACLFTLHLAAVPLGAWAAMVVALMVSIAWNLVLFALRRRAAAKAGPA
jgi:hypothetical protein